MHMLCIFFLVVKHLSLRKDVTGCKQILTLTIVIKVGCKTMTENYRITESQN